jgi:polar amino acid transport system substrate-binding protein
LALITPKEVILRTAKYVLLVLSLFFTAAGCGGGKEGPDAFSQMKKNKMVRIATDAVNLPFEFGSGTGVQGLDVDIGSEIGKDLGYEVKWVKVQYGRLFDILQNGEAELIISAIAVTAERKKDFAFSETYFDSGNTIARRIDKQQIKDLASLAGKRVGVQAGRTGDAFMETQKVAANVTIQKYPTFDDALGALNRTEIDAVVGDDPILTYDIYKSFPNLMTLGVLLTHDQYAVVVRKGEKELLDKVNDTLQRLKKSRELDELRKKWFQNVMEEAAVERKKRQQEEQLKESPKSVSVGILKTGGNFNMDRLDGFQLVLVGPAGTFQSTPILTSGLRGNCKFTNPIPPGEYKLNMSILRMTTTVIIPKLPKAAIALDLSIGSGGVTINAR